MLPGVGMRLAGKYSQGVEVKTSRPTAWRSGTPEVTVSAIRNWEGKTTDTVRMYFTPPQARKFAKQLRKAARDATKA